jgi:hypothetical protein
MEPGVLSAIATSGTIVVYMPNQEDDLRNIDMEKKG